MIHNGMGFYPPPICYPCIPTGQQTVPNPMYQQQQTPGYKLYDFNGTNSNEIIRVIFAFTGISYKDKRVKEEEWIRAKDRMAIPKLPILRVNNHLKIYDLHSIVRYLAREFRLYGQTNADQAIVDMIFELTSDFQKKFFEQADHADQQNELFDQLEKLHQLFNRQGPFYLGSQLSLADLMVYQTSNYLLDSQPKLLDNYPRLQQIFDYFEKYFQVKNSKMKRKRHRTVPPTVRDVDQRHHRPRSHDESKPSSRHRPRETILFVRKKSEPKEEEDVQIEEENQPELPETDFQTVDQQSTEIIPEEKTEPNND